MTLDEFFEVLATRRYLPWRVLPDGEIIAMVGVLPVDPITALPNSPRHWACYEEVAAEVGLSDVDMRAIFKAASWDESHGRPLFDPKIRSRLLDALGMKEWGSSNTMNRTFRRKPLVWREDPMYGWLIAAHGDYRVEPRSRGGVVRVWVGKGYLVHASIEAAQAAAEAHWQSQPPPEGYEEVTVCACGGGYVADDEAEDWLTCPDCGGSGVLPVEVGDV